MRKKNILIYRLGSLGDTIIVLPAFHLIRQTFPDATITLLTNEPINGKAPAIHSILENSGLYDNYIAYNSNTRNLRELLYLLSKIRKQHFDTFIYLAKPKGNLLTILRDYLFFRIAIVGKIVGIPWRYRNRKCLPISTEGSSYEWDCIRTLRCINKLGSINLDTDQAWNLSLTTSEIKESEVLLNSIDSHPFIALSVGTKASSKDWEEHNWDSLVKRLRSNFPTYKLVFIGSADESERSNRMLADVGGGIDLCGKTSPRIAAAILKRAALFVGHDSGPMHLAACVGTKVVAIFSARNLPGEWFPRGGAVKNVIHYKKTSCFGCGLVDCFDEKKRCILSISVDEVYESIVRMI